MYVHGWDPGDPEQPTAGASVDAQGNCLAWDNTGTVTVAPDGGGINSTVTWVSGSYFGLTFTAGSTIYIGSSTMFSGTPYTIANTSYTQAVLNGTDNKHISIVGTVTIGTATAYNEVNPPNGTAGSITSPKYTPGCGDDLRNAVIWDVDGGWVQDNYIEKVHEWNAESHALSWGFDYGPMKLVNNWVEGGAISVFSGGGALDSNGGPARDNEIRRNYIGKDLNWRQLSAGQGPSPFPPFGCGPSDGTASHSVCPFAWGIKNAFEMKEGDRTLIAGNVIGDSWVEAQSGWCIIIDNRPNSGGSDSGIYDPATGYPLTPLGNIRLESNWMRNCSENSSAGRAGFPPGVGGGGIGLPSNNVDVVNNLLSNFNDVLQFGNLLGEWTWTGGDNSFLCSMSGTGTTATGQCAPLQYDISNGLVTSITASSGVVTIAVNVARLDPILCVSPNTSSQCIGWGWTVTLSGLPTEAGTGWNGTFAMGPTSSGSWGPVGSYGNAGTGGNTIVYTDAINNPNGTFCSSLSDCNSKLGSGKLTYASLGYWITDIASTSSGLASNGVYASNVSPDTTCTTQGYAWSSGLVKASTGSNPTGTGASMTVVFPSTGSGSAICLIDNGAGLPLNRTFQSNTVLSINKFAISSSNSYFQPVNNLFFNNVFADNDATLHSDIYCGTGATEGTAALNTCWDPTSLQFWGNVLMGRGTAGACTSTWNYGTPINGVVNNTCPSLASGYPSGSCIYDGSNPMNCPLMGPPWSNNFSLSNVAAMSITSSTQGVNITQLTATATANIYTCPTGLSCGSHGPYPDH